MLTARAAPTARRPGSEASLALARAEGPLGRGLAHVGAGGALCRARLGREGTARFAHAYVGQCSRAPPTRPSREPGTARVGACPARRAPRDAELLKGSGPKGGHGGGWSWVII